MVKDLRFDFPDETTGDLLCEIVAADYVLGTEDPVEATALFYDTFDWRLFKKSLVLCRTGDEWTLRCLKTGADRERLTSGSEPGFVWEIADSPLKRRIASIVGVRRLLPVGEATFHTASYRVLNADSKTVVRLSATKVWAVPSDNFGDSSRRSLPDADAALLDFHVVLRPVRGYGGHFRRLAAKFEGAGLTAGRWQETFERIVSVTGKQPGVYSAKPDYRLKIGTRADEATKEILRSTLAVIRANEEGIKADWDIEFLHDFRTAVRRTRSALGQIPGVFAPEVTEQYKEAFAQLGSRTNQLRDLDVYLLSEPDYRAMLPEAMRDHISPLFNYMRAQRGQALREVVDYLNSTSYADMLATWEAFLLEPVPDSPAAPNAALPIDELARRRIAKQYRRVIKDGKKILDSDEDEPIHQLRIDCKKLRYLMEFFASLFPKKEIGKLIKQLKALQDELGVFNDLSVQQVYLLQMAEVLPADDAQARLGLVAVGSLVERLASEQQAMKPGLADAFSDFAAASNRALFRRLFGGKEKATNS